MTLLRVVFLLFVVLACSPAHGQTLRYLHAIVRPDISGNWHVQNDETHSPYGIDTYSEQSSTYVRIFTCCLANYTKAGVITITTDDDFGADIEAHANVGLNNATLFIYADVDHDGDKERINPADIWTVLGEVRTGGNLWITMVMKE